MMDSQVGGPGLEAICNQTSRGYWLFVKPFGVGFVEFCFVGVFSGEKFYFY